MTQRPQRHLSDDRLLDLCLGTAEPAGDDAPHLSLCPDCAARHAALRGLLDELGEAAAQDADAHFSDDRLARQHARILHRIEMDGRPGRLIAFPAVPPRAASQRTRPHVRWAAAAAAAAFVVGVLAGHLVHELPADPATAAEAGMIANESDAAPLRAVSTTFSEDEFLQQIETAAGRGGPAALRPLDAMTPRAWEVR